MVEKTGLNERGAIAPPHTVGVESKTQASADPVSGSFQGELILGMNGAGVSGVTLPFIRRNNTLEVRRETIEPVRKPSGRCLNASWERNHNPHSRLASWFGGPLTNPSTHRNPKLCFEQVG